MKRIIILSVMFCSMFSCASGANFGKLIKVANKALVTNKRIISSGTSRVLENGTSRIGQAHLKGVTPQNNFNRILVIHHGSRIVNKNIEEQRRRNNIRSQYGFSYR